MFLSAPQSFPIVLNASHTSVETAQKEENHEKSG